MSPETVVEGTPPSPLPRVQRTFVALGILYLVELWGYGAGWVSLMTVLNGIILLTIGILVATFQKNRNLALNRASRAGAYLALGVLSALTVRYQNATARQRAEQVVTACRNYQLERGRYPSDLQELVPGHLPQLPAVKSVLFVMAFHYSFHSSEPGAVPSLWYHDFPAGPRWIYRFDTGRWQHHT